jgi:hypothetical protein
MSGAGAPKAQQQQQPATSNGRPGTESGGKKSTCNDGKGNGVAVDVGTSGDGPDGEQEEQQQEHQQNPAGARKHQGQASSQKMQPVIAKFSTNETKLLKKQADRLQYEQRVGATRGGGLEVYVGFAMLHITADELGAVAAAATITLLLLLLSVLGVMCL